MYIQLSCRTERSKVGRKHDVSTRNNWLGLLKLCSLLHVALSWYGWGQPLLKTTWLPFPKLGNQLLNLCFPLVINTMQTPSTRAPPRLPKTWVQTRPPPDTEVCPPETWVASSETCVHLTSTSAFTSITWTPTLGAQVATPET